MVVSTKGIEHDPADDAWTENYLRLSAALDSMTTSWRSWVYDDFGASMSAEVAVCRGWPNSWTQDPRRLETGLAARFSVVTCEEEANDDEVATKKKPRSLGGGSGSGLTVPGAKGGRPSRPCIAPAGGGRGPSDPVVKSREGGLRCCADSTQHGWQAVGPFFCATGPVARIGAFVVVNSALLLLLVAACCPPLPQPAAVRRRPALLSSSPSSSPPLLLLGAKRISRIGSTSVPSLKVCRTSSLLFFVADLVDAGGHSCCRVSSLEPSFRCVFVFSRWLLAGAAVPPPGYSA